MHKIVCLQSTLAALSTALSTPPIGLTMPTLLPLYLPSTYYWLLDLLEQIDHNLVTPDKERTDDDVLIGHLDDEGLALFTAWFILNSQRDRLIDDYQQLLAEEDHEAVSLIPEIHTLQAQSDVVNYIFWFHADTMMDMVGKRTKMALCRDGSLIEVSPRNGATFVKITVDVSREDPPSLTKRLFGGWRG